MCWLITDTRNFSAELADRWAKASIQSLNLCNLGILVEIPRAHARDLVHAAWRHLLSTEYFQKRWTSRRYFKN